MNTQAQYVALLIPVLVLLAITFGHNGTNAQAAQTKSWSFDDSANYTFDSSKIEISSSTAQLAAPNDWFDDNWKYRRKITIDNTSNNNSLSDFPVTLHLGSRDLSFNQLQSDGADLRFTDSGGTSTISHWTEEFDQGGASSTISVEVPSIPASGTTSIYMYYGNSSTSDTSSFSDTFEIADSEYTRDAATNESGYQAFPALEKLDNGDLLIAYRDGSGHVSDDGKVMAVRSTDGGDSWGAPFEITDDPDKDDRVNVGLKQLSSGKLILPFFRLGTCCETEISTSSDNGATWSTPKELSFPSVSVNTSPYGKIRELSNGTLLMPVSTSDDSLLAESTDGGSTWSKRSTITTGESGGGATETSVLALTDSNILAAVRIGTNPDSIYLYESTDGGSSWSSKGRLMQNGVSPHFLELNNGDIMLCVGDRGKSRPDGVRCHVSEDDGDTWSRGAMVYEYGSLNMAAEGGYPSAIQKSNGDVLLAFYTDNATSGKPDIETVEFDPSILTDGGSTMVDVETGNLDYFTSVTGSVTEATSSEAHSGSYSLVIDDQDTVTLNKAYVDVAGGMGLKTGSISFWLKTDSRQPGIALDEGKSEPSNRAFKLFFVDGMCILYYTGSDYVCTNNSHTYQDGQWDHVTLNFDVINNEVSVFFNGKDLGTMDTWNDVTRVHRMGILSRSTPSETSKFYVDDIYTRPYASPQLTKSVNSTSTVYSTSSPTIKPTAANAQSGVNSLSGFSETATLNNESIAYQLSNDGGSSWQYWDGGQWTSTSAGVSEANNASTIDSNIGNLSVNNSDFLWRGYLQSNGGTSTPILSNIDVTYTGDASSPSISSVSATPSANSSTISWSTNEVASTQIEYGLTNNYGATTTETDTSTRVTSHSQTVSGLASCTEYHYRVLSTDAAGNQATGSDKTFTTPCTNNASVSQSGQGDVPTSGGSASLTSGSANISLSVPNGYAASSATFQLKQIDRSTLLSSTGKPSGKTEAGDHTYNLNALTSATTTMSSFQSPISITITYTDSDVSGLDESSLAIYRWDGASWNELTSCSVDTAANTVSCDTSQFSDFALFGDQANSSGSSGGGAGGGGPLEPRDTNPDTTNSTDNQQDDTAQIESNNKTIATQKISLQLQGDDLPSDPQQLIARLTQRVQSLQSQLDSSATADTSTNADTTPDCTFSRNLDVGMKGNQVRCLQETLNQLGHTVAGTGPGSVGSETTYFGPKTKDAVIRLQEANADQILTPVGLTSGTGYFGPSTREFLNNR